MPTTLARWEVQDSQSSSRSPIQLNRASAEPLATLEISSDRYSPSIMYTTTVVITALVAAVAAQTFTEFSPAQVSHQRLAYQKTNS